MFKGSTGARDSGSRLHSTSSCFDSDEAGQALERLVFSLVGSYGEFGVRDYRSEADAAHLLYVAELEEQVRHGDLDAMFHLSRAMHDSAMSKCLMPDLHRAEALLVAAAQGGHLEAKKRLETAWPLLKATTERRIGQAA
jgi:hypothetical protein